MWNNLEYGITYDNNSGYGKLDGYFVQYITVL